MRFLSSVISHILLPTLPSLSPIGLLKVLDSNLVKLPFAFQITQEGLKMRHGFTALELPSSVFRNANGSVIVVKIIYKTLGKVLNDVPVLDRSRVNSTGWILNSELLSITVMPRPSDVIEPPVKISLKTNQVRTASTHHCQRCSVCEEFQLLIATFSWQM